MQNAYEVRLTGSPDALVLALLGEIDTLAAESLRAEIERALAGNPTHLTVDLSATTFLDSAGITELVALRNGAADCGCAVNMVPGPANVMRVLNLVGLADMFDRAG